MDDKPVPLSNNSMGNFDYDLIGKVYSVNFVL